MKLSEVLEALLNAEDETGEMRGSAEREAKEIIRKAHDKFAQVQETRLTAAREEARAQVESTKRSVDIETQHIAEMAQKAREKMQEHFDRRAPELIADMTEKAALEYAAHGRA
jgi:vacuolar-type H+-ATPase subunit H